MSRILIVEDDQPFAEALALTLRLGGHDVLVAVDADDGIQLGLAYHPDVVIADWMLKNDLHGGEVCRRIRADRPHTKTIIITGYPDAVSAQIGRWRASIEAVVEKPFHKEQIIEAIDRALSSAMEIAT
jgi:DNA-binding response OmpR family regulator